MEVELGMRKFHIRSRLSGGFSLLEVVAGFLLVSIFVALGLQLMVASMTLQIRGSSYSEAGNWIQEDLEAIKDQAALFQITKLSANAPKDATKITVDGMNGFSTSSSGNRLRIGDDQQTYTIRSISGNEITIFPGLEAAKQAGLTFVSATNYCNATSLSHGFALAFRESLPLPQNFLAPQNFSNQQQYVLLRGGYASSAYPTPKNEPPFQVLEISYQVKSLADNSIVAKVDTEVIPNAALRCP